MIHSRVSWMCLPVERSITVSPPQRIAQVIFSTSSPIDEVTAELPMLALIFTRKLRPMIIGSISGWLMFAGMMARPRATSSRTNSGVISAGMAAPNDSPGCWRHQQLEHLLAGLAGRLQALEVLLALQVLADGDELHLRRDDAPARVVHLRDVPAGLRAARLAVQVEAQLGELRIVQALAPVARSRAGQHLGVAALVDPRLAQRRQPGADVDLRRRVGVRARRCRRRRSAGSSRRRTMLGVSDWVISRIGTRSRARPRRRPCANWAAAGPRRRRRGGGGQELRIGVHLRLPTAALPASGSKGFSHPSDPHGTPNAKTTIIIRWPMNLEQARTNMVEQQIRTWEVLDQDVLDLLYVVPREEFVPRAAPRARVRRHGDSHRRRRSMWQPKLEARVLQELMVRKTDRVLEVGTGSGYLTALLVASRRAGGLGGNQSRRSPRSAAPTSSATAPTTSRSRPAMPRAAGRPTRPTTSSCSPARRRSCRRRSPSSSRRAGACSRWSARRRR